jgi:outer membrane lipoprotein SlyB
MNFETPSVWAGIISGGLSQYQDTKALQNGQIDRNQYAVHTTKNISGAAGLVAGIEYGAVLGSSLLPGVGSIVGSIFGAILGDRLGRFIGLQAGQMLFNRPYLTPQPIPYSGQQQVPYESRPPQQENECPTVH